MTYRAGVLTGVVATLLLVAAGGAAWWIMAARRADSKASKPPPAASVAKPVKEDELNTVTLTPEAEERLGVAVAKVARRALPRVRAYGGEVVIPPGQTIQVAAPLGGALRAAPSGMPVVGKTVKKGQPIFQLLPLLTPEAKTTLASAKVDAETQIKNAQTQVNSAKIALDRAERLLREEAGSRRNVDEAQAQYELALKILEGAHARRDTLDRTIGEIDKGTAAPINLDSPLEGVLRSVNAQPDQTVPSGAILFEVAALDRIWVRVPVYVGDLSQIAEAFDAEVGDLAGRRAATRTASFVNAPPSANPLAATVDLYYSLDNRKAGLVPGQRVGVSLPLRGVVVVGPFLVPWRETWSLSVPWSAVVHDIHGGTWVYEQTAPRTYNRRRVTVSHVANGRAALTAGPPEGTTVVTEGAQELFGAETGFSK